MLKFIKNVFKSYLKRGNGMVTIGQGVHFLSLEASNFRSLDLRVRKTHPKKMRS